MSITQLCISEDIKKCRFILFQFAKAPNGVVGFSLNLRRHQTVSLGSLSISESTKRCRLYTFVIEI